jgi:hypothetical protein
MRDPARIKRICDKLEILWGYHPDQRLGQLLENYIFGHHSKYRDGCIFHVEDDGVERKLDELIKEREIMMFKQIQENKKEEWKERTSHFDDDLDIVGDEYNS